jgi:DNA polymerase III psi subunit
MQAQQPITQDIVVEDVLKAMTLVDGAVEYLVLNSEGIAYLTQEYQSRRAPALPPNELCTCPSCSWTTGQQRRR